ncbi:hypothetical protein [Aureimonas ureilytica]|uniref:hypothetical protein n=1 Tax=Aureimonas ureilytica TaxID=401562 RepID=UPI0012DC0BE4|nr:hypothetical protein [Aureimonas ureilytica]
MPWSSGHDDLASGHTIHSDGFTRGGEVTAETLPIRVDCRSAIVALTTLIVSIERFAKPGQGLFELIRDPAHAFDHATAFDANFELLSTGRARKVRIQLKPAQAFFERVRALRASDVQLERIVHASNHEVVSQAGRTTCTVTQPEGWVP